MQPLIQLYDQIPVAFKNKYVLTAFFFVIWILFFDTSKVTSQIQMRRNLAEMKQKQDFYRKEIKKVHEDLELFQNPDELEKFARENYFLKKDEEEIIILEEFKKSKRPQK